MRSLVVGSGDAASAAGALAARGHAVARAAGADEALEALVRGPAPDAVVVASGDGAAAASAVQRVRAHVRGEGAALLALVPADAVEAALDAGADWALPSPAPAAAVAAAIASVERAVARRASAAAPAAPGHDLYFTRNPSPMWFYDLDTLGFVAVNDAALEKYGWSREELLRMTIKDIRPPDDLERLLRSTGRVDHGLEHTKGWRHRARDGRVFHVEIISYPVRFAGRPCELVLAHDVSDRVEAERKVEDLRAQVALADRMASLGTLAAGVAHEIANPLTFVLANLAFAQDRLAALRGDDAAAVAEAVADAVDGARRVRAISRDLKGFSRADGAAPGAVDVAGAARSALALAATELSQRARIVVDVAGAPPALATEARLGQLLLNLVLNAAQATPEGAADANVVCVTARGEGGWVVIDVSDTGPGVPAAIRPHVFDPFFTTKPAGQGTGLGLWVCRRIATELGGSIDLVPSDGPGATFRVRLPAAAPAAPAADAVPPAAPAPVRPAAAARRPRVLVVDDEPLVGRALRRALRDVAELELEPSSRAAVARLARGEPFDLVLCDVRMPELPGPELHAQLERVDAALARRVVFMTGGASAAREQEFLARIPNVCLEKPFDLARLRALVAAAG